MRATWLVAAGAAAAASCSSQGSKAEPVDAAYLLDISADHAEGLREFPELSRHDPFDRLSIAQAHQHRLTLMTADGVLLGLGRTFVVDSTK